MHKYKCSNIQKIHNCVSELLELSENSELRESSEFSENDSSSTGGKACALNPPRVRHERACEFFQESAKKISPQI